MARKTKAEIQAEAQQARALKLEEQKQLHAEWLHENQDEINRRAHFISDVLRTCLHFIRKEYTVTNKDQFMVWFNGHDVLSIEIEDGDFGSRSRVASRVATGLRYKYDHKDKRMTLDVICEFGASSFCGLSEENMDRFLGCVQQQRSVASMIKSLLNSHKLGIEEWFNAETGSNSVTMDAIHKAVEYVNDEKTDLIKDFRS